eukprot:gene4979-5340_t
MQQDLLLSSLIGVQSCYREISSPSKGSDGNQMVWIGQQAVEIFPEMIAYEIIVRNDVYEEKILEITEQLTLSYSAKVMKHLPSRSVTSTEGGKGPKSPMIHVFNDSSDAKRVWNEILIVVGCNCQYERVVFLLLIPPNTSQATAATSTSFSTTSSSNPSTSSSQQIVKTLTSFIHRNREFIQWCEQVISHFSEAYYAENITVFNDAIARNQTLNGTPQLASLICEGILDLSFIRDLQLTSSQLMNQRILKEVNYLDTQVIKLNEMKCAKLMTLLKPYYQKAGIALPVVPTSRALTSYPLILQRDTIKEPTLETARLLLLKARKNYRTFVNQEMKKVSIVNLIDVGNSTDHPDYLTHEYEVSFLTKELVQQLNDWSEEEYSIRMKRKMLSVQDRLDTLKQFSIQLLLTLHNRFVENHVNSIIQYQEQLQQSSSGISSLWTFSSWNGGSGAGKLPPILFTADYQLHVSLREKFAFLDVDEPIIVECQGFITQLASPLMSSATSSSDQGPATTSNPNGNTSNRKGTFYFTLGNVMFYSVSTLLYNPVIVVMPMKIIQKIELYKQERLIASHQRSPPPPLPPSSVASPETSPPIAAPVVEQKPIVLPLSALAGTVSIIQANSPTSDISLTTNSSNSTAGYDDVIVITDISGQQTILRFSELTPDFSRRVYDLLELLLQERLFELRYKPKRPFAAVPAINRETIKTDNGTMIEQQINEEIERLDEIILQTSLQQSRQDRRNEDDAVDENLLEFEVETKSENAKELETEKEEIDRLADFFSTSTPVPVLSPSVPIGNKKEDEQVVADLNLKSNSSDSARVKSLSQQDLNSSSPISPTTAAVDTGGAKSKRNLAGGIQKFLSQSQVKPKVISNVNSSSNSNEGGNISSTSEDNMI